MKPLAAQDLPALSIKTLEQMQSVGFIGVLGVPEYNFQLFWPVCELSSLSHTVEKSLLILNLIIPGHL